MPNAPDTAAIYRLIGWARRRIRGQWALEGATTALIIAAAAALATIFAVRTEVIDPTTGIALLVGAGGIVLLGALASASRRLDDEVVARRIDRASQLADRLSTAISFTKSGWSTSAPTADDDTTHELMLAAIRDGVRAVPRADVKKATPFAWPKDLRAAIGFLAASALVAGLALPSKDRTPHLFRANPDVARPGAHVTIEGENLLQGVAQPIASIDAARVLIGAPGIDAPAPTPTPSHFVPSNASVHLGTRVISVLDWAGDHVDVRIPDDAPVGNSSLSVYIGGQEVGDVKFTVVSKEDVAHHDPNAVEFTDDEERYIKSVVAEMKAAAERDKVPELKEFAGKIEKLMEKAKNGEITKQELLAKLQEAEEALTKNPEPNPEEVSKKLSEMGKELKKDQMTKELGDALEKKDLEKAQKELEKLAEKLDKKELTDKQKEELGKKLDQVAKQMEKQEKAEQKQQDQQQQKLQEQIRRLEKEKQEAKNERQRQDAERRLEQKQRELEKLKKEQEQKDQSEQRRAVKRLQKDMEQAAESLKKPDKDKQGDQQDQENRDRQASQKLKDAARETGRVDKDQRKQAAQKKNASKMEELREAMQRAKQKGNKGPNDPFNKNRKNQDFISRARGQKSGQGQSWKPGEGQDQGQGKGDKNGQNGGKGQQPGQSDTWGVGHDPNLTGDPTAKVGNEKDEELKGTVGKNGSSTRETILASAQKGFSSQGYKKVYQDYTRVLEEVMRTEKLPSSYKYYVKRYFAKIHPTTVDAPKKEPTE
jgi:hypothetical protein